MITELEFIEIHLTKINTHLQHIHNNLKTVKEENESARKLLSQVNELRSLPFYLLFPNDTDEDAYVKLRDIERVMGW